MTQIKICGITNLHDARAAVELGADALGFNFYAASPRFIAPQRAREIIAGLPHDVLCVGVFVNEASPERVASLAMQAGVGALQLHGDESPEFCRSLNDRFVIKALRVGADFAAEDATKYGTHAIMLDAYSPRARGGTGRAFDWSVARRTRELVPKLFLAGGLTPENVGAAIGLVRPFAVDVCSGVESQPGRKNLTRLRAFVAAVRRAAD